MYICVSMYSVGMSKQLKYKPKFAPGMERCPQCDTEYRRIYVGFLYNKTIANIEVCRCNRLENA